MDIVILVGQIVTSRTNKIYILPRNVMMMVTLYIYYIVIAT